MLQSLALKACGASIQCYVQRKENRACRIETLAAIIRYGDCCQNKRRLAPRLGSCGGGIEAGAGGSSEARIPAVALPGSASGYGAVSTREGGVAPRRFPPLLVCRRVAVSRQKPVRFAGLQGPSIALFRVSHRH